MGYERKSDMDIFNGLDGWHCGSYKLFFDVSVFLRKLAVSSRVCHVLMDGLCAGQEKISDDHDQGVLKR